MKEGKVGTRKRVNGRGEGKVRRKAEAETKSTTSSGKKIIKRKMRQVREK